jgi:iron(III) transport system ATP-binding protein
MSATILELVKIVKQFDSNDSLTLDQVSFSLQPGEILSILGPSGCGKTTLLRAIAGFERPQSGEIRIAGRVVNDERTFLPPEQRQVGVVFQDYALFPHLTVAENAIFGLKSWTPLKAQSRVTEVLELVKLNDFSRRYPHELSGGQQQRVALARALANRPKILLLDEPLSNLDVQVRGHLRSEIREILKLAGMSAIFVTHDREEAMFVADRVAVMQAGKLEQFGTPEEIYQHPASRFVAEFVAQANLFGANLHGDLWQTEVGDFPATEVAVGSGVDSGEIVLRADEVLLTPAPHGLLIVRSCRFIGRDYQYALETPSGRIVQVKASSNQVHELGTRVNLAMRDGDRPLFFANS